MGIIRQGETVYQQIKGKLQKHLGEFVAIDVETGDYFLGKDMVQAYEQGKKKYPHKEFFFKRIGAKATFVVGTRRL